jgi:hypothetical protein
LRACGRSVTVCWPGGCGGAVGDCGAVLRTLGWLRGGGVWSLYFSLTSVKQEGSAPRAAFLVGVRGFSGSVAPSAPSESNSTIAWFLFPIRVQLFGEAMLRYHHDAVVHKLPSVVTRIGWLVSLAEDDPTSVGEVERAFMRGLYVTSTSTFMSLAIKRLDPSHTPLRHTQVTHFHSRMCGL